MDQRLIGELAKTKRPTTARYLAHKLNEPIDIVSQRLPCLSPLVRRKQFRVRSSFDGRIYLAWAYWLDAPELIMHRIFRGKTCPMASALTTME